MSVEELTQVCHAVIREQPALAESVRAGKTGLAKLIGLAMKKLGSEGRSVHDANSAARVMRKALEEK